MQKTLLATNNSLKLLTSFFQKVVVMILLRELTVENWDWRAVSFLLYPGSRNPSLQYPFYHYGTMIPHPSGQPPLGTHAHWRGEMAIQSSVKINSNYLLRSCGLRHWEGIIQDQHEFIWWQIGLGCFSWFWRCLKIHLYQYKNKPTEKLQWHKRDTAGLYLFNSFFFFIKGSWMPVMLKPLQK